MRSKQQYSWILGSAVIVALSLSAGAFGAAKEKASVKEQELSKKDLPAAVLTAFGKTYPKAVIREVGKETDSVDTRYEIKSTDGDDKRTLSYLEDGTVAEIEEIISLKDLPQPAQDAISRDYPKAKAETVEKVTRQSVVTFEALLVVGEERTEVVFDSTGKLVKAEKTATEEKDKD